MEMPSRTCELDIIPTKFLKKVLMHCISAITKVVNLSLSMGHFYEDWKSIKKGTEKSNYRPVSNYNSSPKLSKNAHLTNLLIIATNITCYQSTNPPIENITVVRPVSSSL